MARNRRINEPGAYHHITARGVDRCAVFEDDDDRRQFLALLNEARSRFGCEVLAFCLMTNHIHLTIRDNQGSLSKTQHFLNGVYAKRFNHKHGRTGHLFERRFWSSMLDSDAYLAACVEYVHRNPVEAGMVKRAEDYRWSSYPSYIGRRSIPRFLNTSIVLAHYGDDTLRLRAATEGLAEDDLLARQLRSPNPPAIIGVDQSDRQRPAGRQPELFAPELIPLDDVVRACADAFNVELCEVRTGFRGRPNPARGMVAFVAQRHVGHPLKDIATALGLKSPAAASLAAQRFAEAGQQQHQGSLHRSLMTLGLAESRLIT